MAKKLLFVVEIADNCDTTEFVEAFVHLTKGTAPADGSYDPSEVWLDNVEGTTYIGGLN